MCACACDASCWMPVAGFECMCERTCYQTESISASSNSLSRVQELCHQAWLSLGQICQLCRPISEPMCLVTSLEQAHVSVQAAPRGERFLHGPSAPSHDPVVTRLLEAEEGPLVDCQLVWCLW